MKFFSWKKCIGVALVAYLLFVAVWALTGADLVSLPDEAEFTWREIFDDVVLCFTFAALTLLYKHFFFSRYQPDRSSYELISFTCCTFLLVNLLSWAITLLCLALYGEGNAVIRRECMHLRHDSTLLSCIFCSVFYLYYSMRSRQHAERLKAKLFHAREAALQTQLQLLRVQVDPHFMFNNFSILSGLIEENPAQADKFLAQLTRCYRYITQHLDDTLVPVCDAVRSLGAYVYLIKIRYQDNVRVIIDERLDSVTRCIPPMTLQILVENAIKHNAHSAAEPLDIEVRLEGERLVVSNRLVPLTSEIPSTQRGLRNVRDRYALLGPDLPEVQQTDSHFIVTIPLI